MTFSMVGSWLEAVWLIESRLIYEEEFDLRNTKFSPKELLSLEDEDYNSKLRVYILGESRVETDVKYADIKKPLVLKREGTNSS